MRVNSNVASCIEIEYDGILSPRYPQEVDNALSLIRMGVTGCQLIEKLTSLSRGGKKVTIRPTTGSATTRAALTEAQLKSRVYIKGGDLDPLHNQAAVSLAQPRFFGIVKGAGASAVINWNPDQSLVIDENGRASNGNDEGRSYLILGHELVHANRILKGTYTGGASDRRDPATPAAKEERRAIGIGEFLGKTPSENSIRQEHGEPLRWRY
ncbi:XopG/HopH/AvrPtoH family type III secretion system effector [Burkholderia metallica]|uniref:XopG/HopH/AvrPtoH family type III secretion system effector n=1 Tax=Burkholderia metallica TaxID=488729 RepID=UPI001CF2892D|nr:XopG/HopH/AvrPtoH family type III secretion system effector [Burkholderia metallica]MCA8003354.1 type III secretion system effector protein [Burkholderia metallica]